MVSVKLILLHLWTLPGNVVDTEDTSDPHVRAAVKEYWNKAATGKRGKNPEQPVVPPAFCIDNSAEMGMSGGGQS